MKKILEQNIILKWAFFISLALALCLIFAQVIMVISGHNLTNIESILINMLVFILSIVFSGIFTYLGAVYSFKQSQKDFAFSAFRRIKEIESATITLEEAVLQCELDINNCYDINKKLEEGLTKNAFNTLKVINLFLKRTIKSSIDDWSQIIGDEIVAIKNIEQKENRLKELENLKLMVLSESQANNERINNVNTEIDELSGQINILRSKLPLSLKNERFLNDDKIDEVKNKKSIPIGFSKERILSRQTEFFKSLNQSIVIMNFGVSSKLIDNFMNNKPVGFNIGDILELKKDEKDNIYLESERGQITTFMRTGFNHHITSNHILNFISEKNINLKSVKAEVLEWNPEDLMGKVKLSF